MDTEPTQVLASERTESQVLNSWIDDPDANRLFTHQHVDADAAFSAALVRIIKPGTLLNFVPANQTIEGDDSIGVDMLNGDQTVKGLEDGSAFGLIVATMAERGTVWRRAFGKWANQINLTDSGKWCRDSVLFVQLVRAWRRVGLDDASIVDRAYEILSGHLEYVKADLESRTASEQHPINDGIAIILDGQDVSRYVLFKRGARVIIYHGESFGQCIMLSKNEMKQGRSFGELDGLLPDHWFIHPAGFLAAHGTKKAPQPLSTSGISLENLNSMLLDWLNTSPFGKSGFEG